MTTAAVLAGIGLFVVGTLLSLFTGRGAVTSGLRMVLIGGGAGVITYLIGHLLGGGRWGRRKCRVGEAQRNHD